MLVTIPIPDPHPTARLSQALLLAPGYGALERPAQGKCRGMFTRAGKENRPWTGPTRVTILPHQGMAACVFTVCVEQPGGGWGEAASETPATAGCPFLPAYPLPLQLGQLGSLLPSLQLQQGPGWWVRGTC